MEIRQTIIRGGVSFIGTPNNIATFLIIKNALSERGYVLELPEPGYSRNYGKGIEKIRISNVGNNECWVDPFQPDGQRTVVSKKFGRRQVVKFLGEIDVIDRFTAFTSTMSPTDLASRLPNIGSSTFFGSTTLHRVGMLECWLE